MNCIPYLLHTQKLPYALIILILRFLNITLIININILSIKFKAESNIPKLLQQKKKR